MRAAHGTNGGMPAAGARAVSRAMRTPGVGITGTGHIGTAVGVTTGRHRWPGAAIGRRRRRTQPQRRPSITAPRRPRWGTRLRPVLLGRRRPRRRLRMPRVEAESCGIRRARTHRRLRASRRRSMAFGAGGTSRSLNRQPRPGRRVRAGVGL
jgi:hypothetical protein